MVLLDQIFLPAVVPRIFLFWLYILFWASLCPMLVIFYWWYIGNNCNSRCYFFMLEFVYYLNPVDDVILVSFLKSIFVLSLGWILVYYSCILFYLIFINFGIAIFPIPKCCLWVELHLVFTFLCCRYLFILICRCTYNTDWFNPYFVKLFLYLVLGIFPFLCGYTSEEFPLNLSSWVLTYLFI